MTNGTMVTIQLVATTVTMRVMMTKMALKKEVTMMMTMTEALECVRSMLVQRKCSPEIERICSPPLG